MRLGRRLLYGIANSFGTTLNSSCILVSTCQDVHHNLALEDWIYENASFVEPDTKSNFERSRSLVLLWRNRPCIVIGRHQNCWVECLLHKALDDNVKIARRRSGGGTVYHDLGNLNVTVFTNRNDYNRKRNLNIVADALKENFKLNVAVAQRDDLILNEKFKVSGTAAKLGGKVAYHHFTLLVDANLDNVKKYLSQSEHGIESKATASVRSDVANLTDVDRNITFNDLIEPLSKAFTIAQSYKTPELFTYVDPTNESAFPGINDLVSKLKTWDWVYGHTPKFKVQRTFSCSVQDEIVQVAVNLEVDHGLISNSELTATSPNHELSAEVKGLCADISTSIDGLRFWPSDVKELEKKLLFDSNSQPRHLMEWAKCLMNCIYNTAIGN